MPRAYVGLGANLGDRQRMLQRAVALLGDTSGIDVIAVSTFRETDPVGVPPQPRYLNGAVTGRTEQPAERLLKELHQIELDRGRQRPYPGAPRTLDLDLLLYGEMVVDRASLRVPHPRYRERRFVLEPLAEIAPGWRDPVTGLTVRELLKNLTDRQ